MRFMNLCIVVVCNKTFRNNDAYTDHRLTIKGTHRGEISRDIDSWPMNGTLLATRKCYQDLNYSFWPEQVILPVSERCDMSCKSIAYHAYTFSNSMLKLELERDLNTVDLFLL